LDGIRKHRGLSYGGAAHHSINVARSSTRASSDFSELAKIEFVFACASQFFTDAILPALRV
jgi:L-arabinose isomerase